MCTEAFKSRQRIMCLLDRLDQGDSRLAVRCRDDREFCDLLRETATALVDFYMQMDEDDSALRNFEGKLRKWIEEGPAAYLGFAGELFVAGWLRRQDARHLFVRETQKCRMPDIELVVVGKTVDLEVKTLEKNYYDSFADRILEEIQLILPDRHVRMLELKVEEGAEEALVARAVEKIRDWCKAPYAPIQYSGEEGEFSLLLPLGRGIRAYWPESVDQQRVRQNGTPWAESKLREALTDTVGKCRPNNPLFLVWVNSDDPALSDSIKAHVVQVLKQYGQAEFAKVAGVIVLDGVLGWNLTENRAHPEYRQLKDIGLFEAVDALKLL